MSLRVCIANNIGALTRCTVPADVQFWLPQLAALTLPQLTRLSLNGSIVEAGQWSASLLLSALAAATPRLVVLDASRMCNKLCF